MTEYISKSAVVAEIKSLMRTTFTNFDEGINAAAKTLLEDINTFEVKRLDLESKVWHDKNTVPKYNLNGVTDFIVSSCYGHIEGVAYSYTPEQWSAHLGFEANREFRWAYEKDLIEICDYDRSE